MQNTTAPSVGTSLNTLPTDDVRQLMWRFADRYELQMLVQGARGVARGPVARLVAEGARNSHEWTPLKASLLPHFDESGITAAFLDPEDGGFIPGPKNLALALIAFELSWVDAGAATFVASDHFGTPMHGGVLAYADPAAAKRVAALHRGDLVPSLQQLMTRKGDGK